MSEHSAFVALNTDAWQIAKRIQEMDQSAVLSRYHELVDKRLENELDYKEVFELHQIDARLNAEDNIELQHLGEIGAIWENEKTELATSIAQLLSRLVNR